MLICVCCGLAAAMTLPGQSFNRLVFDCLTWISTKPEVADRIVIVTIDEPSFARLNLQWPWPRSMHAEVIKKLFSAGAKTIAIDLLMPEPSDALNDAALAEVLNENVVLASSLETSEHGQYLSQMHIKPLPLFLKNGSRSGLDILSLDPDGFLRQYRSMIGQNPSFAAAAASAYTDMPISTQRNETTANRPSMYIRFTGPPGTIKTIPYSSVLQNMADLPIDIFKDKLVFIGLNVRNAVHLTTLAADHYPTPFVRFSEAHMAGVEVQANIAAGMINQTAIRKAGLISCIVPAALCLFFAVVGGIYLKPFQHGMLIAGMIVTVAVVVAGIYSYQNVYIPSALTILPILCLWIGSTVIHYFKNLGEKRYIRTVFSRYVSKSVVAYLLENPEKLRLGGDFFQGTVLFLDIKHFTELTSSTPARELIRMLSRYLGTFADIVMAHNGMVDKIAGDAIMAVWGVPVKQEDHAGLACRAAIAMEKDFLSLQAEDKEKRAAPLEIRIGVNSGTLLAGNIGGKEFTDFTVHGVDVNLANKLETMNNTYGTRILIGEKTHELIGPEFVVRKVDRIRPKGYNDRLTIYELSGTKNTSFK